MNTSSIRRIVSAGALVLAASQSIAAPANLAHLDLIEVSFHCKVSINYFLDSCNDGTAYLMDPNWNIFQNPVSWTARSVSSVTPNAYGYIEGYQRFFIESSDGLFYEGNSTGFNEDTDQFMFNPNNGSQVPYGGYFDGGNINLGNVLISSGELSDPFHFVPVTTPVPEPTTSGLMILGLSVASVVARCRRAGQVVPGAGEA